MFFQIEGHTCLYTNSFDRYDIKHLVHTRNKYRYTACSTDLAVDMDKAIRGGQPKFAIRTRPAGPMAIQLWTKNIKKLVIASYASCFCPNFKSFRAISYRFKDKDILHTN